MLKGDFVPHMLSTDDQDRLTGVHIDLVRVLEAAAEDGARFQVLEGLRTEHEQRVLVAAKVCKSMDSRHLTGHAVTLAVLIGSTPRYQFQLYARLWEYIFEAGKALHVPVQWGQHDGDLQDPMVFQLPRRDYPRKRTEDEFARIINRS